MVKEVLVGIAFLILAGIAFAEENVPVVDAHLGVCSTTVTVLNSEDKPVYNAKITVDLHYGFLGVRKMSLEVGTNSDGKATLAGLPEKQKKPFEFQVTNGSISKKVLVDAATKCKDVIQVKLGGQ
jgi:hypothetical protein